MIDSFVPLPPCGGGVAHRAGLGDDPRPLTIAVTRVLIEETSQ